MPRFSSARKQAIRSIRHKTAIGESRDQNINKQIHSYGTERNYIDQLTQVGEWLVYNGNRQGTSNISPNLAIAYLEERAEYVIQKTLDLDRQALQTLKSLKNFKLPVIKSSIGQTGRLGKQSRAYTFQQIDLIKMKQSDRFSFATELIQATGIRAQEMYTLRPIEYRNPTSGRNWSEHLFKGLEGKIYTVQGKGGLVRAVMIPSEIAHELEKHRHDSVEGVRDRRIIYKSLYDVTGGQNWSQNFSKTSKFLFEWSNGGHGLRHGYAQRRMKTLQMHGFLYKQALEIVSQEMGHFRPEITETYLR